MANRRPRPAIARLVIVLLAVALLHLLTFAPLPGHLALWRALSNALHAPAFAAVATAVMATMRSIRPLVLGRPDRGRRTRAALARYAVAFAVTAVLAAIAELSQVIGPRTASLDDWLRDILGAAAGLVLYASAGRRAGVVSGAGRAVIWTARLAAVTVLATGFLPVAQWGHAYLRRDAAFPVLGTFEAGWETLLWRPRGGALDLVAPPPGWPRREGARVARIRLEPGRYPGVRLEEPPAHWIGYDTLQFSLYSPDPGSITLSLRIHDAEHQNAWADRYNTAFEIGQGHHTLHIALEDVRRGPQGRELDLSRVAGLALFVASLAESRTLYLDDVRLIAREDGD